MPDDGRTFHVFVSVSVSPRLLKATKDLFPWRKGKMRKKQGKGKARGGGQWERGGKKRQIKIKVGGDERARVSGKGNKGVSGGLDCWPVGEAKGDLGDMPGSGHFASTS